MRMRAIVALVAAGALAAGVVWAVNEAVDRLLRTAPWWPRDAGRWR
jgi:hypothetical protein